MSVLEFKFKKHLNEVKVTLETQCRVGVWVGRTREEERKGHNLMFCGSVFHRPYVSLMSRHTGGWPFSYRAGTFEGGL